MAVKDGKEYVTFVTKQIVSYMETPKDVRRQSRSEAKQRKEHWAARWFGMAPFGIVLWWRTLQDKRQRLVINSAEPRDKLKRNESQAVFAEGDKYDR